MKNNWRQSVSSTPLTRCKSKQLKPSPCLSQSKYQPLTQFYSHANILQLVEAQQTSYALCCAVKRKTYFASCAIDQMDYYFSVSFFFSTTVISCKTRWYTSQKHAVNLIFAALKTYCMNGIILKQLNDHEFSLHDIHTFVNKPHYTWSYQCQFYAWVSMD